MPDFIARVRLANAQVVNLVIEVSGQMWDCKPEKDETMHTFWIPAINNWGRLCCWEHREFDKASASDGFDYSLLSHLETLGGAYA